MTPFSRPGYSPIVSNHGFIGLPFVKQHMMVDDQWTAEDLTEQFKFMGSFWAKFHHLKRIEKNHSTRDIIQNYRSLQKQCRKGRDMLQGIRKFENRRIIRNLLLDNKEQQCLYQHMTVHQVLENIDQRTFLLRKEYDRLNDRKMKLTKELEGLKLKSAALEDRINFQNAYELDKGKQAKYCERQLANSKIRLKAIKIVNTSYKKILQVLRHDEVFYEPILRSLYDDINDQRMFIENILDLGKPALLKFRKLKDHFKQYDDKVHKEMQSLLQDIASKNKLLIKKSNQLSRYQGDEWKTVEQARKRYVRTTKSMGELENEMLRVSEVIKNLKFVTLCSNSTEVFPRIKGQIDHNYKLKKEIICDSLCHATMETKEKFSEVLQDVIKNNLSQAEINRLGRIAELNDLIGVEDKIEMQNIKALKRNNDVLVLLRVFLWNIYDMLHHVYKSPRLTKIHYPNSYLKLPLLKFEMMATYACPPDPLGDDVKDLFSIIRSKLKHLMLAYNTFTNSNKQQSLSGHHVKPHRVTYMDKMIAIRREYDNHHIDVGDDAQMNEGILDTIKEYETGTNARPLAVPNRKQIKARSIYLIEERLKND